MKCYLQNQKGSAMLLALLTMVFLAIVLSGLVPLVNSQMLLSSKNNDVIEAQYAAEAGAKRAIVGFMKNRLDWAWSDGTQQSFCDPYSTTEKNYVVTIDPPITNGFAPTAGTTYTITSVGSIGKARKSIILKVKAGSGDTVFQYGIYSGKAMSLWSGTVNGNVGTSSNLAITGATVNGNVFTNGTFTIYSGHILGNATYVATPEEKYQLTPYISGTLVPATTTTFTTLDISSLMKYAPTIPTIPSFPTSSAGYTAISSGAELIAGNYYCDGDYSNWSGNNFNIASGQSLVLYVNGTFTGNFNITGGGNILIYAKKGVALNNNNISGSTIEINSGTTFALSNSSSINGSISATIQSVSDLTMWDSNYITGDTVACYSGGVLSFGGSTNTTGKLITLQSTGSMNLYGSINQSTTSGIVNAYSGGTLSLQGKTTASSVTMIALASYFNGGIINPSLSGAVSKLYIVGDVDLNSNIAIGSYGTAMIISLGKISMNGASLSTTSLLAAGDINSWSGSCGGVYSNGAFSMSGGTVTYDPLASTALGLNSGAPFSIISWNDGK